MTDTTTVHDPSTVARPDADTPMVRVPASVLRDLLAGALVAVGRDDTLPTLTGVRLEWQDGTLAAVSTDRYRLAVGEYAAEGDEVVISGTGSMLIPGDMAKALVKALPKAPRHGREWERATLTVADNVLTVTYPGGTMTSVQLAGEFPKWRSLMPTESVDTGSTAWNPTYMADVAKIPHERNMPVQWQFHGTMRPALASYAPCNGISWRYLLMPVRVMPS